jgi:hypothetical protein
MNNSSCLLADSSSGIAGVARSLPIALKTTRLEKTIAVEEVKKLIAADPLGLTLSRENEVEPK